MEGRRRPGAWVWALLGGALGAGCGGPPGVPDGPPLLVATSVDPAGPSLDLAFDEPVGQARAGGDFQAGEVPVKVEGQTVKVPLPPRLTPGRRYHWTAEVQDSHLNLTTVGGRFFGPNDHPATLRLNEVRVAGSGTKADFVELRVEAPGSLGGWTLEVWSTPQAHTRKVFPDVAVEAGDLVVLHFKAGTDADETGSRAEASGPETRADAWDFWQEGAKGLPGTKGAAVLRPTPTQAPGDGLAWEVQAGGGSSLATSAGWTAGPVLDPRACTATRTWSRTDQTPPEWIVTEAGGATPGEPNCQTPWAGPTASPRPKTTTKGRPRGPTPRGRGRPNGPGSTPGSAAAATGPGRPRPRGAGAEGRSEPSPGDRDRPGLRGPEAPRPRTRPPGPRGRGETARRPRGPGGAPRPRTPVAPGPGRPRPGTDSAGHPRRGEATPVY